MQQKNLHVLVVEDNTADAVLLRQMFQKEAADSFQLVHLKTLTEALAHLEKGWLTKKLDLYGEPTRTRLLEGQEIKAIDYLRAQHQRRIFSSSLRTAMHQIDALALPTIPIPAVTVPQMYQEITIEGVKENSGDAMLRLTMPFNLAGLPAMTFPCGFNSQGLPLGLQIAGKPFEEGLILRVAYAYQQLTDWHRSEIKNS